MSQPPAHHNHWATPIEAIDAEISQLAVLCGVALFDHGVIERLLHNDAGVCSHPHPQAFEKMRQLLMMHFVVTEKAVRALGAPHVQQLAQQIASRLQLRFGHRLGRSELTGPGAIG